MKKYYFIVLAWLLSPTIVLGASQTAIEKAKEGLQGSAESTLGTDTITTPAELANSIVNTTVTFLGIISVVLIVYGGAMWLTAAGKEDKVTKAKQIITRTVIGVVIVGFAYAITQFILTELISATE